MHRTSPQMTWTSTLVPPLATSGPSFEPHTPPPSAGVSATTMMGDHCLPSVWGAAPGDYDAHLGEVPTEDMLLVKGGPNAPSRPLHTYMAPLSLGSSQPRPPSPPPSKRIDMRLARPGSEESKPGYLTPLATYTAQTFWYFWYADMFVPVNGARRVSSESRPFDSEGRARHPIPSHLHPNLLTPNLPFSQFVFSVLHSTQVSFSVTILALMYTYKYKKIMAQGLRAPYTTEVTEAHAFVTALMLANKYLDDNTYTNTTWAQFLGLPVGEVNKYELEWLDALEFNLCVRTEEFEAWRSMLDAHVRNRERDTAAAAYGVSANVFGSPGHAGRARSASPPLAYYSPNGLAPPLEPKKRSAREAFSADVLHNTGMYEAARLGARKSSFAPLVPGYTAVTALPTPSPSAVSPAAPVVPSGLGRSSSLNRQIARLPVNGVRRDSQEQEQLLPAAVMDLRHAAAHNWGYMEQQGAEPEHQGWRMPVQPRLYFLQAAATPQFGPDPRYHKAIPHYFDAGYDSAFDASYAGEQEIMEVDPNQMNLAMQASNGMHMGGLAPPAMASAYGPQPTIQMPQPHPHFVDPQPAQFANAGPPGYSYGQPGWQVSQPNPWAATRTWKPGHATRWSTSSDEGMIFLRPPPVCTPQWSQPPVHAGF